MTVLTALLRAWGDLLRPRILVYGRLLLALLVAFAWGITHRDPFIAEALRDRNALYRITADGIENGYTLKLVNKTDRPHRYRVRLDAAGQPLTLRGGELRIDVAASAVSAVPLTVLASGPVRGRHEIAFIVESDDGRSRTVENTFFGPQP